MSSIPKFHLDILGRRILPGDFVISQSYGQELGIYVVERLTEKMLKLKKIKSGNRKSNQLRYPDDCVKVEGPEVTLFLLNNPESN
jgi:hypothetical protein